MPICCRSNRGILFRGDFVHHRHHGQAPDWSVAVSRSCFRRPRSWACGHAEFSPRLSGWRSASRVRSQVWRGRVLGGASSPWPAHWSTHGLSSNDSVREGSCRVDNVERKFVRVAWITWEQIVGAAEDRVAISVAASKSDVRNLSIHLASDQHASSILHIPADLRHHPTLQYRPTVGYLCCCSCSPLVYLLFHSDYVRLLRRRHQFFNRW